jgi:hypothetical protein
MDTAVVNVATSPQPLLVPASRESEGSADMRKPAAAALQAGGGSAGTSGSRADASSAANGASAAGMNGVGAALTAPDCVSVVQRYLDQEACATVKPRPGQPMTVKQLRRVTEALWGPDVAAAAEVCYTGGSGVLLPVPDTATLGLLWSHALVSGAASEPLGGAALPLRRSTAPAASLKSSGARQRSARPSFLSHTPCCPHVPPRPPTCLSHTAPRRKSAPCHWCSGRCASPRCHRPR